MRDKSLGIEGRLSSADRARLHNVFNGVLPPDRRMPIVRLDDPNDPRLSGLMITQLVLEDGWLGLAVGPAGSRRVAERRVAAITAAALSGSVESRIGETRLRCRSRLSVARGSTTTSADPASSRSDQFSRP